MAKHRKRYTVEFYERGKYVTDVQFKNKFLARLFHEILNRGTFHAGVRDY